MRRILPGLMLTALFSVAALGCTRSYDARSETADDDSGSVVAPGGVVNEQGEARAGDTENAEAQDGGYVGASDQTVEEQGDPAFSDPPPLASVDGSVSVVEDYAVPTYYVDNSYWSYRGGVWYRAYYWDAPWVVVEPSYVPVVIVHRDHDHYVHYHHHGGEHVWHEPHENHHSPHGGHQGPGAPHQGAGAPRTPAREVDRHVDRAGAPRRVESSQPSRVPAPAAAEPRRAEPRGEPKRVEPRRVDRGAETRRAEPPPAERPRIEERHAEPRAPEPARPMDHAGPPQGRGAPPSAQPAPQQPKPAAPVKKVGPSKGGRGRR